MAGITLCKRCEQKGLTRETLPGKPLCQYCNFIKWKTGPLSQPIPVQSNSHDLTRGNERRRLLGKGTRCSPRDQVEATLKQIMTAKSRFSSDEAEANQLAAYAKKPFVWRNSITLKFVGQTLADEAKKARKYKKQRRFKKLANRFPIRKIRSHSHYRETLTRALQVDTECRAVNYAYLKLLDFELAKYEEKFPDACKRIWIDVCNAFEKAANANTSE